MNYSIFWIQGLILLPSFLIALTFHEFSHAWMASFLGDDTAKRMGRLSLNPLVHIDPFGLLFLLIFRIGWARPVIFNPNNFRYPRIYSILTGLAGPFSNFILAVIFLNIYKYTLSLKLISAMVNATIYVNVMLGVFNLLPLPPLDGSHVLYALIPESYKYIYFMFSRYYLFILILLFMNPNVIALFLRSIIVVRAFLENFVV